MKAPVKLNKEGVITLTFPAGFKLTEYCDSNEVGV